MLAFDLWDIVAYSTYGNPNRLPSSINLINNNILRTKSLVAIFARNYSFSDPELASCTAAIFSCFLNSGQQSLPPRWPEPRHAQQRPWRESVILSLFLSFFGFESGLYHVPDHPAGLVAVGFLSFLEFPPAAEPPLVAEPCELDPRENFEEDCCCLLSCLGNVYVISFQASSISRALSKTALMLVNLRPSNGVEMPGFSDLVNFTILSSVDVFTLIQSLKIRW